MSKRGVGFTYTHPVTFPAGQRGARGQHRMLARATAEHLQSLGYGWIDGQEPPPKPIIENGDEYEPGQDEEFDTTVGTDRRTAAGDVNDPDGSVGIGSGESEAAEPAAD